MPPSTSRHRIAQLVPPWILVALLGGSLGCDFFEELESAESAGTGSTGGSDGASSGTGDTDADEACVFPDDDLCIDQDRLQVCAPDGVITLYDCGEICGGNVNFTCLGVGAGYHGCWCAAPGQQKVLSCSELESCLRDCETAPDNTCSDQCFTRTTASTVRMLGALVHCAHKSCQEICIEAPELCATCIQSGIDDGAGPCGLERSVCDADQNDEPGWP